MSQTKQTAFTQAYATCEDRFVRYCTALAYGKMETEDLVQDVLLATYERFEQIQYKEQLLHYLVRAARNRSISHWRKAQYQTALLEQHTRQLFATGLNPEIALDIQLLYQKLGQLSESQRDAVILFEICGFSMKEIAEIQQASINTVKSHLKRGRKKLRQLMEERPKSRWFIGILFGSSDHTRSLFFTFKQSFFHLKPIFMYSLSTLVVAGSFALLVTPRSTPAQQLTPTSPEKSITQQLEKSSINHLFEAKAGPVFMPKNKPVNVTKTTVFRESSKKSVPKLPLFKPLQRSQLPLTTPTPLMSSRFDIFSSKKPTVTAFEPSTNDCDSLKIKSGIHILKRTLLRNLKRDRLIRSKKAENRLSFKGQKVLINKTMIPEKLQKKYLNILAAYNVYPCPKRIIKTASKYIGVGRVEDGKFIGAFRLQGRVDIDNMSDDDEN